VIAPTIDPADLSQAGWGVIFEPGTDPSVREALSPLLALRREQSRDYYRESSYRPGETASRFLARHGVGPGPIIPGKMPYYLLIVGSPNRVPYRFQQQLDVGYAVGRLHFDDAEMYRRYADTATLAERSPAPQSRQIAVFAPKFAGDQHTQLLAQWLLSPLAQTVRDSEWRVDIRTGDAATKATLAQTLGGSEPPAILVAATHTWVAHRIDPSSRGMQGALICADWPGPGANVPLDPSVVFSAADVIGPLNMRGMIAVLWGSFTVGYNDSGGRPEDTVGDRNAVAPLAQHLLGAASGGALAVIGFVDRMLGFSLPGARPTDIHRGVTRTIRALTLGQRVGQASQALDETYASAVVLLNDALERMRTGQQVDALDLSSLWTVTTDLRNVALLGDPAVRLPAAAIGVQQR
jgi:hypothetical protein